MRVLITIWFLGFTQLLAGQSLYTERDSIEDAQIMREFFYKTKFQVTLSHERTLLKSGVNVKMNILKLGIQYKKNYKMGMYFGFSKTYNTLKPVVPNVSYYETVISTMGAYFEYVMIENYRWYVGIPTTIGRAKVSGSAVNNEGNYWIDKNWESNNFGVFSLGANGGYNINHWLTLSAGLGYRFTSSASPDAHEDLNTLFYTYGVKFKFGHFLTSIIHPKRVRKMKSIYFRNKDNWAANRFKDRHPEYYK